MHDDELKYMSAACVGWVLEYYVFYSIKDLKGKIYHSKLNLLI